MALSEVMYDGWMKVMILVPWMSLEGMPVDKRPSSLEKLGYKVVIFHGVP